MKHKDALGAFRSAINSPWQRRNQTRSFILKFITCPALRAAAGAVQNTRISAEGQPDRVVVPGNIQQEYIDATRRQACGAEQIVRPSRCESIACPVVPW